jgi:hypothetical protein
MPNYTATFTGETALIMHADDVERADDLMAWRKDPQNKKDSTAGDDRSPAWTWFTYLYYSGGKVAMPQENIMASIRYGGSKLIMKKQETYAKVTQSGIMVDMDYCEFIGPKGAISIDKMQGWVFDPNVKFSDHKKKAAELGIDLLVKRATVGTSKHVRVRPKFDGWRVTVPLIVSDPALNIDVLTQILNIAGQYAGIGDWRPSSKKAGPYGRFSVKLAKA